MALLVLCIVLPAEAESFPLWEAGAGVSALSLPDYRGSDESRSLILPIPYFLYRGETLRIDRQSVRTVFYEGQRSELDLSFAAAPPVNSEDNRARAGMPDLDPVLEAGISWKYSLWQDQGGNRRLRVVLPIRGVMSTDFRGTDWAGWVLSPGFKLDSGIERADEWKLGSIVSLQWASKHNNAHFYTVGAPYATAERPVYSAGAGYGGVALTLSATRRFEKWWVGSFLRYDNLRGASFEDSPLVKTTDNWWGGVAISRIFLQSGQRVERDD